MMRSAPRRLSGSGPVPSIGFLTDWMDDDYHWQILRGAMDAARDSGSNLFCFVGGAIATPGSSDEFNWLFRLARPRNVDGLILLSGSLGNQVGSQGLTEFFEPHRPMPMCSIAVPLAGMSSLCIDNEAGMRMAVEHLIRVHAVTRIAFIRGPAVSDEAELRLRVYREVLEANGLPYDPGLVVSGDFTVGAGREAVRTLFVDRKLPVTAVGAIIGANDAMALGALDELRRQGIRVPDQVALAGFDNIEASRFVLPPLTTVNQPLKEQGREAVRILLEHLRSPTETTQAVRRTELIVRRSCGCLPGNSTSRKSSTPPSPNLGFDAALLRRRQHILADMARAGRGELGAAGAQWDSKLLSAAAEQIRGDSADAFVRAYDDLLRRLLLAGTDPAVCNDVLSALRGRLVRCISDPKRRMAAEDFFHEARIMTTSAVEGVQTERRIRAWTEARSLMQAGAAVMSARDIDELSRAVHEQLPRVGIARCFVVCFDDDREFARVILAERPDARKSDPTLGVKYPALDVLRQAVVAGADGHAFAAFPAKFAGNERALVVVELTALEDFGYESLRQLFAAVLGRMAVDTSRLVPQRAS